MQKVPKVHVKSEKRVQCNMQPYCRIGKLNQRKYINAGFGIGSLKFTLKKLNI